MGVFFSCEAKNARPRKSQRMSMHDCKFRSFPSNEVFRTLETSNEKIGPVYVWPRHNKFHYMILRRLTLCELGRGDLLSIDRVDVVIQSHRQWTSDGLLRHQLTKAQSTDVDRRRLRLQSYQQLIGVSWRCYAGLHTMHTRTNLMQSLLFSPNLQRSSPPHFLVLSHGRQTRLLMIAYFAYTLKKTPNYFYWVHASPPGIRIEASEQRYSGFLARKNRGDNPSCRKIFFLSVNCRPRIKKTRAENPFTHFG